jgi:hypothetical protein
VAELKRLITTLVLATAIAAAGAVGAGATITSTSGAIVEIAPPASVQNQQLRSETEIRAFEEKQCVTLASPLNVDVTPGGGAGVIPAGTSVRSDFIHFDPSGAPGTTRQLSGSITVGDSVLGVATSAANLDASDFLGAPGTAYPTGTNPEREFENSAQFPTQGPDSASISGGQLVVNVSVVETFHFDQARVISACPPPPPPGDEGCTPGYWKQPHHFDSWQGFTQSQKYEAVFGVNVPGNPSLLQALGMNGGGINALERHSTAALLNASSSGVDYPFTVAQVIAKVQSAVANGTIEATKNELEDANELGCPLN